MAAGDLEIFRVESSGNARVAHGRIELDFLLRNIQVLNSGYLLDFALLGEADQASANVKLNEDATGSPVNGSIAARSNTKSSTEFLFRATFI